MAATLAAALIRNAGVRGVQHDAAGAVRIYHQLREALKNEVPKDG
jgi:hypothetical protein